MKQVAILLFDDVDLLDVGGPYEVFLTADRLATRIGAARQFNVVTVSADGAPVISYGGMGLTPSMSVGDLGDADVVIIPGAIAIDAVSKRPEVQAAVATLLELSTVAASVCTGAFLLGDQGVLDDIAWTTHFEDVDQLGARIDSDSGTANVNWVDVNNVVTSGGLSSGIAMALHLIDRLHSRDLAVGTARQIEYDWDPDAGIIAH